MKTIWPRMALAPITFGFISLALNLDRDRVAALHGSDIVGLVTSGFCFGVAFMILLTWFLTRREGGGGR